MFPSVLFSVLRIVDLLFCVVFPPVLLSVLPIVDCVVLCFTTVLLLFHFMVACIHTDMLCDLAHHTLHDTNMLTS